MSSTIRPHANTASNARHALSLNNLRRDKFNDVIGTMRVIADTQPNRELRRYLAKLRKQK
jgi:hypothetical protein